MDVDDYVSAATEAEDLLPPRVMVGKPSKPSKPAPPTTPTLTEFVAEISENAEYRAALRNRIISGTASAAELKLLGRASTPARTDYDERVARAFDAMTKPEMRLYVQLGEDRRRMFAKALGEPLELTDAEYEANARWVRTPARIPTTP